MNNAKLGVILYVILKLVFNRRYEGEKWLDNLYYVIEPLCFTLVLLDLYFISWVFEICFYVALSSFIRQLLIYVGIWEYDFIGRKYFVEFFFLLGIGIVFIRKYVYKL